MKFAWRILMTMVIVLVLVGGCKDRKDAKLEAVVETDMGKFGIELFSEDAPNTVKNFVTLAKRGFYNGLTFHRVVKGFVIQGGDPLGDGTGGPGYTIAAEFNDRKHLEGTVAMARGHDVNSAGSQFYICLAPQPGLDRNYTVFGQVTWGMDVVHKIGNVPVDKRSKPLKPVHILKITINKPESAEK